MILCLSTTFEENQHNFFVAGNDRCSWCKVLYENFQPMIPKLYRDLWKEGIDTNSYYLKLCGSGGGGYILGFTKDFQEAQVKLSSYQLDVIHRF